MVMEKTASDILFLIKDIRNESSRIGKEGLVRELAQSEFGKFVIKWTYNPFVTFGIRPALSTSIDKPNLSLRPSLIEPLLEKLARRELTGHAAEGEIFDVMTSLDPESAELLYLILSKDLKCGIASTTINVAVPGMIPTFAVQRAQAYEERFVKETWPWKAEYKLDGQRNTFLCKDGKGSFFTRTGKVVPALDFLVPRVLATGKAAAESSDTMRDLLIDDDGGLSFMLDGEAMMGLFAETGKLRSKGKDATNAELHLYDIMSYEDFDAPGLVGPILEERRKLLSEFVKFAHITPDVGESIQIVPQFFVNSDQELQDFFEGALETTLASYLARGDAEREKELLKTTIDGATGKPKKLEGAMAKNPKAQYEKRKGRAWLKLKVEDTKDLKVIGAYKGDPTKKYADTLGGLIVDHEGVEVYVGGGFSDEERDDIWALWMKDMDAIGVDNMEETSKGKGPGHICRKEGSFILLNRLIEVRFHEVTPDKSLRHPRYYIFRDDKDGEVSK